MSDWWTRHELRRVADELQRIREERLDPTGTAGCLAILTMIAIPCLYIVPKTIEGFYKDQVARQERHKWAQLPKEQQKASIKKVAIETHAEYKKKLEEICIANETRWRHSEINCSYIKEDFLRNYCPPTHLFKDVSDPAMCTKLKKTSNNW
jgi:hypothetical protein